MIDSLVVNGGLRRHMWEKYPAHIGAGGREHVLRKERSELQWRKQEGEGGKRF